MVVPDDLQYYPLSGRFIKKSALEQRGFRITKKTAYKDYIAAFKMANTKNIKVRSEFIQIGLKTRIRLVSFHTHNT